MKKVMGILVLLLVVMGVTALIDPKFLQPFNLQNIARWTGMYGIMTIGEAFVIITGGIDLSVGSIVGLVGSLLPMFVRTLGLPVWLALLVLMGISLCIGLIHGLLITRLRLQPFVVTLCGLFVYRGISRYVTGDATQGFGTGFQSLRYLASGSPLSVPFPGIGWLAVPMPFLLFLVAAVLAGIFLNQSIYGRYLKALGRNEQAARYSGVNTNRMIMTAYVLSALAAGFSGILFALDLNSVQPSGQGNFFELYAIAGAVLGGCSLRGGEGSILGVVIGTAIVRVLYNAINILGIATQLEFAVIGAVILAGVSADEILKQYTAARKASREAKIHLQTAESGGG
ncbi:MAG: ABC transporter permease [Candidatus Omnitrophica bacterium]|nr:ABC transporter permease [Candidatus Omnitrophota bacterium]